MSLILSKVLCSFLVFVVDDKHVLSYPQKSTPILVQACPVIVRLLSLVLRLLVKHKWFDDVTSGSGNFVNNIFVHIEKWFIDWLRKELSQESIMKANLDVVLFPITGSYGSALARQRVALVKNFLTQYVFSTQTLQHASQIIPAHIWLCFPEHYSTKPVNKHTHTHTPFVSSLWPRDTHSIVCVHTTAHVLLSSINKPVFMSTPLSFLKAP